MAQITSDQFGIILGGSENIKPQIIRESHRGDFPADAAWIPSDKLASELQHNPALRSIRPAIEAMVDDFEHTRDVNFAERKLSDGEATAIVEKMLGKVLRQDTLAARLIRFAMADPDLKMYIIEGNGVQAYALPEPDGSYMYLKGFCDDREGHTAIYCATDPLHVPEQSCEEVVQWLLCEELLHHAMKRLYGNNCEVYPVDDETRFTMLDKGIDADRQLIRHHYNITDPEPDAALTV